MIDLFGFIGMFVSIPLFTLLCISRLAVLIRDWSFSSFRVIRLIGLAICFFFQIACYFSFYPLLLQDILESL